MREFPLLDLADAWKAAHQCLADVQRHAEALWAESEDTWLDMMIIRQRVVNVRQALGTLPPGILDGIAQDEADLDELEDRADAARS
jgi:hypothetical protein